MEIFDVFQYDWAVRALIASSLVGVLCGILGCFIILRNMALIGDALSHAILPGVVAGFIIAGHSMLAFFTGSVVAGLITALLITLIQRNVKTKEDAAIGIVFTSMFAIGVMGISWVSRQEGVHLDMKDFLFGNVLGIANQDLWLTSLITVFVITCIVLFYRYFFITTFQSLIASTMGINVSTIHYFLMLLLSFAVVASLQSVGVILVVAMLIIPASTAFLLTNRLNRMIVISAIIGLISTIGGLLIAILFETTPGPAMTVTGAFIYFLTVLFSPQKGLVNAFIRKRAKQSRILQDDILKHAVKLYEVEQLNVQSLQVRLGIGVIKLRTNLRRLSKRKLLSFNNDKIELTKSGTELAYKLIRAHRLWETYLVERMGMTKDHIHDQAEKYEHILPEEILHKMEVRLGFPKTDPHGSLIPQKNNPLLVTLSNLKVNQKAVVMTEQLSDEVALQLWKMAITPNTPFLLKNISDESLEIQLNNRNLNLDKKIADQVKVAIID